MSQILLVHEMAIDPLLNLKKLRNKIRAKQILVLHRYGIQYFKVGFFWMKLYSNCNFDFLACLSWLLGGL